MSRTHAQVIFLPPLSILTITCAAFFGRACRMQLTFGFTCEKLQACNLPDLNHFHPHAQDASTSETGQALLKSAVPPTPVVSVVGPQMIGPCTAAVLRASAASCRPLTYAPSPVCACASVSVCQCVSVPVCEYVSV